MSCPIHGRWCSGSPVPPTSEWKLAADAIWDKLNTIDTAKDEGDWIATYLELCHAVREANVVIATPRAVAVHGCVCPPGSEKSCKGPLCPRLPIRR